MKKIIALILVVLLVALFAAWQVFGPTISSPVGGFLYIKTGTSYAELKKSLDTAHIISNPWLFDQVSKRAGYHEVKPGKYEISRGSSLVSLVRMLKRGSQVPVKLVINKLRTKEDLASKVGRLFEADSAAAIRFLTSNDSLSAYQLDTNTVMTIVIPDTYLLKWNGSFKKVFLRLLEEKNKFWTKERIARARAFGLDPGEVYTLASIVEEETNKAGDKGLIASVYFNRINKGMRLEADPTVKYAMRNFGLKRILHGHLDYSSPYNTYRNSGLPPGPISTATRATMDSVLNMPATNYIFFVAKPDFNGYSNFASTYTQHLVYAKAYQQALDSLITRKKNQ